MIYVKGKVQDDGELTGHEMEIKGIGNEIFYELMLIITTVLKQEVIDINDLREAIEVVFESYKDIDLGGYSLEDSNG